MYNWFLFSLILIYSFCRKFFFLDRRPYVCVCECERVQTILTIRLIRNVFVIAYNSIAVYYHKTNVYVDRYAHVIISFFIFLFKKSYHNILCVSVCTLYVTYVVHHHYILMLMSRNVYLYKPCLNDIITFHFINIYCMFD